MLTFSLFQVLYALLLLITLPLRALPDVALPAAALSAIATAYGYLNAADVFLPVSTALIPIFLLVISIETAIFGYKFVMWVKNLFW